MVVSPLEGVKNEHFIVWMRVATMPTFRKFYGYLEQPIAAGTTFNFEVQANYDVNRFEGTKSLIVSTNTMFGGKNSYFGPIFYWSGYVCLIVGCFFVWKQGFRPRKIGDESYLHFKQE
jgi:LEM3 (ligand-effect modulator 3) family / CDC50 family